MNGRYDFLILHLLSREEMYGFQVIKKVSDRCTDAEFELKTGMLYPLLSALEAKGYLSSRLVPVAGRERKVYHLLKMPKPQAITCGSDEALRHIVTDKASVVVPDGQRGVIQRG